jgi:hypothetical protein
MMSFTMVVIVPQKHLTFRCGTDKVKSIFYSVGERRRGSNLPDSDLDEAPIYVDFLLTKD